MATFFHWWDPSRDPVPRPINAIILTGLSLATIMSHLVGRRLECRIRDRQRDERDREWREGIEKKIDSLIEGLRPQPRTADETTVNLARRNTESVVYASASVSAVHCGGEMHAITETVGRQLGAALAQFRDAAATLIQEADERIDRRLGALEMLAGNHGEMNGTNGAGVTRLPRSRT